MTTPTVEQPDDQHSPSRWKRTVTVAGIVLGVAAAVVDITVGVAEIIQWL